MNVETLMTHNPKTCGPGDTLDRPAQLMWDNDCGCVPVVDEQRRPIGMVTDRDICMAAHLEGQPLRNCRVEDAMSSAPQICHPQDSLTDAAKTMAAHKIRRLPVVDDQNHLLGIVSLNDLVLAGAGRGCEDGEIASTLAQISEHRPNRRSAEPN